MGSYATPLAIGVSGIIISTLLLAAYHFIFFKCCSRDRRAPRNNNGIHGNIKSSCCGVQDEILNKIPVITYSINLIGLDQIECSICLGELEDGDLVRVLPSCNHAFHIPCIDAWFKEHESCPFCRSEITRDIEESMMMPNNSDEVQQERVLHEFTPPINHHSSDNHNQLIEDVCNCTTTSRYQRRHSISISSNLPKRPEVLKRSLSMDETYLYIRMSSVLKRSLSQLRNNSYRGGRYNLGILPN
ncbi:hypothetical protein Lal_00018187 [Lupinus albus]|uniref:RING-type E3 ubiquitin transferase n=1 Tax=Lupinus albus TaxID=3870 RepID=A0A6A5M7Y2_LUPAL|nr:putative transcription factor interactor and regulator LIM family [Lupinus albus]KAF1866802.1 hypothetical protein Lal_00018187 [Lupinus albus]